MALRLQDHPIGDRDAGGLADGVIVWDHGAYTNGTRHDMVKGLECGHLSFWLRGEKLAGGFALTRIRAGGDETWLLSRRKGQGAHAFSSFSRHET